MINRFYSIEHLSTEDLRRLYYTYVSLGWVSIEYYDIPPGNPMIPELSKTEIINNIEAGNANHCELNIANEGERDGILFGFDLTHYPGLAVYLCLPLNLVEELIKEYKLYDHWEEDSDEDFFSQSSLTGEKLEDMIEKLYFDHHKVKSQDYSSFSEYMAEQQLKNPMN